jgi:hypothetical protein
MPVITLNVAGASLGSAHRLNLTDEEVGDSETLFLRIQEHVGTAIGEVR